MKRIDRIIDINYGINYASFRSHPIQITLQIYTYLSIAKQHTYTLSLHYSFQVNRFLFKVEDFFICSYAFYYFTSVDPVSVC